MNLVRHNFPDRPSLAAALAATVARALQAALQTKGKATLAVSGGTTPGLFFEKLSQEDLEWSHITITLVDERHVDETSPRSNAALVRKALLRHRAQAARFVPLFENIEAASALELDCVVLGMGLDGHTASFFPGGDRLPQALDPTTAERILAMEAPGAGEPRLTFTLRSLLAAPSLFLHIEGEDKQRVLAAAEAGTNSLEMPVRAILHATHSLNIFWCP